MYLIRNLTVKNAIDLERIAEKTRQPLKIVSNQVLSDVGLQMNDQRWLVCVRVMSRDQ